MRIDEKEIKNKCCGCSACFNICPNQAITMEANNEGFLYPVIDEEKCTHCGLCTKVCQINNKIKKSKEEQHTYAAMADDNIRMQSSSGGAFTLIAEHIINNGGYVVGAAFSEDFKSVKQIIVDNINDLDKLKGSKYVQSDVSTTYQDTKDLLLKNKIVLYSGTPCQIAGLKAFLGKDYSNLYTLDVLCHGVPSPKVWGKYLEEISKGEEVISASFRSKEQDWGDSHVIIKLKNNVTYNEDQSENDYYKAFAKNIILRKSCYECNYAREQRVSDITLGDFWGIQNFDKTFVDNKGCSVVILNTKNAKDLFEQIKDKFKVIKEAPIKIAKEGNMGLSIPVFPHINRNKFFENMNKKSFKENIKNCINDIKYEGVIDNYWQNKSNYGAILSGYAVQRFIADLGYDYRLIYYNYNYPLFARTFIRKYLKTTQKIATFDDFKLLNNCTDNFVVGTDQVFSYGTLQYYTPERHLLTYTDMDKKRIAFSASFGYDDFAPEKTEADLYAYAKAFRRFDCITVRESSGVTLLKDRMNTDSIHLIDPVLMTQKKYWEEIAKDGEDIDFSNTILTYILDIDDKTQNLLNEISQKYNCEVKSVYNGNFKIETFVKAIKECKYFITDSFHGLCFAIIFHKPVICKLNKSRGGSRFNSLMGTFNGLDKCFIDDLKEMKNKDFSTFNWNDFDKIRENQRTKAIEIIGEALSKKKTITNEKIANELDFIKYYKKGTFSTLYDDRNKDTISFTDKLFSIKKIKDKHKKKKIIRILGLKITLKNKK